MLNTLTDQKLYFLVFLLSFAAVSLNYISSVFSSSIISKFMPILLFSFISLILYAVPLCMYNSQGILVSVQFTIILTILDLVINYKYIFNAFKPLELLFISLYLITLMEVRRRKLRVVVTGDSKL